METMAYMAYMDGVTTNYVRQNLLEARPAEPASTLDLEHTHHL